MRTDQGRAAGTPRYDSNGWDSHASCAAVRRRVATRGLQAIAKCATFLAPYLWPRIVTDGPMRSDDDVHQDQSAACVAAALATVLDDEPVPMLGDDV